MEARVPILKHMLNQTIDLDRTFQALADKSRRTMVERLTLGPASVSQLAEPWPCRSPPFSSTSRSSSRVGW